VLGTGVEGITVSGGTDSFLIGDATGTAIEYNVSDTINGGSGVDVLHFTSTTANDFLTLGGGFANVSSLTIEASDSIGNLTGTTPLEINADLVNQAVNIIGNAGADTLVGTNSSNDTITAGAGANFVVLGNGNDSVLMGNGNDSLNFGPGHDTVTAGSGNDTFLIVHAGYNASDTLTATGSDTIQLELNANDSFVLNGGSANFNLGGATHLTIDATLSASNAITIDATHGLPSTGLTLIGDAGSDTLIGTSTGNDTITAGAGANSIAAGGGNDSITVGNGHDTITTGNGTDNVVLGNGLSDTVTLGTGADTLSFGTGDDSVTTAGSDVFLISTGGHYNGFDQISAVGLSETIRFTSSTPSDILTLSNISATSLTVEASDATGGLTGTTALQISTSAVTTAVTLLGNAGNDTLIGTSGDDTITSGAASNSITGGGGGDQVNLPAAHPGIDTLAYNAFSDSFSNVAATSSVAADAHTDLINNFIEGAGHDVIDLTNVGSPGQTLVDENVVNNGGLAFGAAATFNAVFAGAAANSVDFAVVNGNTYVHLGAGTGYSVGDLLIELHSLSAVSALVAGNFHLH
jgi:Ca2+-binding RTX toxin-like protein